MSIVNTVWNFIDPFGSAAIDPEVFSTPADNGNSSSDSSKASVPLPEDGSLVSHILFNRWQDLVTNLFPASQGGSQITIQELANQDRGLAADLKKAGATDAEIADAISKQHAFVNKFYGKPTDITDVGNALANDAKVGVSFVGIAISIGIFAFLVIKFK